MEEGAEVPEADWAAGRIGFEDLGFRAWTTPPAFRYSMSGYNMATCELFVIQKRYFSQQIVSVLDGDNSL